MINKKYKPQLIARESAIKILYQMKIKDDSYEDVMFSFIEKRPYDKELLKLILKKYIDNTDKITKLYGKCHYCDNKSLYTHRVTNEVQQEVIGTDNYIPICRTCGFDNL